MSLIQEALRKQQEEMEATQKAPGEAASEQSQDPAAPTASRSPLRTKSSAEQPDEPKAEGDATPEKKARPAHLKPRVVPTSDPGAQDVPEPDPQKDEAETEKEEKRPSVWPALLGALTFLTIIALLLYGSWYGYSMYQRGRSVEEVDVVAPPPVVNETTTAVVPPVEPAEPVVTDMPIPMDSQGDEPITVEVDLQEDPDAPSTIEDPIATAEPEEENIDVPEGVPGVMPVDAPETPETDVAVVTPQPPEKKPAVAIESPQPGWPTLTLDGFVGRGRSGTAILNGEMIPVGNTIEGVEVMLIESHAVILRYKGKLRRVRRGQTTD